MPAIAGSELDSNVIEIKTASKSENAGKHFTPIVPLTDQR
ncbi:hypothetical protein QFZ84_001715 [Pseudomonas fluorescens]